MGTPKILIVEDEYLTRSDIGNSLRGSGFDVAGLTDTGPDAVRLAGDLNPDLVLMDITLKGPMNGIEAARQIREQSGIPVVFLTAYSDDPTVEKAAATEPYGYLVKPLDERVLKTTIRMALYKHAIEKRLRESEQIIRVLLDTTDDILFLLNGEGNFLAVNEGLAKRAGVPSASLQGTCAYDLVGKKIFTPKMACWNIQHESASMLRFEEEIGGRWYDTKIFKGPGEGSSGIKYAGHIRDITAMKQVQEQLRQNERYFRALVDDASEVIVILDPDGGFRNESPSLRSVLGILPQKSIFDLIHREDAQKAHKILAETAGKDAMVRPFRLRFRAQGNAACTIEGIASNLTENPLIGGIVLNGWVHKG